MTIRYGHYKLWVRDGWKPNHYRLKTDKPWPNEGKWCRCCHEVRESQCACNDWQREGTRRVVFRKDPDGTIIGLFIDDTVWVHETKADYDESIRRQHHYAGSLLTMHVPVIQFLGAGHFPPTKHTTMNVHDSHLLRRAAPSEYAWAVNYHREALHVMKWWEVMVEDTGNGDYWGGWRELGWHKPYDNTVDRAHDLFHFNHAYGMDGYPVLGFTEVEKLWKEQRHAQNESN